MKIQNNGKLVKRKLYNYDLRYVNKCANSAFNNVYQYICQGQEALQLLPQELEYYITILTLFLKWDSTLCHK